MKLLLLRLCATHFYERVLLRLLCAFAVLALSANAFAGDSFEGRVLYNTPIVPGGPSCSTGSCHGPSPLLGQNRIFLGTTGADITYAISAMREMGFLTGKLTTTQLDDLATYISNAAIEDEKPSVEPRPRRVNFDEVALSGDALSEFGLTLHNFGSRSLRLIRTQIDVPEVVISGGSCQSVVQLGPKQTCKLLLSWRPGESRSMQATLTLELEGLREPTRVAIEGVAISAGAADQRHMVEFVDPTLGYYFQTSRRDEKALLDSVNSFERTGQRFRVFAAPAPELSAVSRFFFDRVALNGSRGGHFYTLLASERELLIGLNPSNRALPGLPVLEGIDSWARTPTINGETRSCGPELVAVYRAFRGSQRFPDDPNHRYTTDFALYSKLISQGWDGEGVSFCVPAG